MGKTVSFPAAFRFRLSEAAVNKEPVVQVDKTKEYNEQLGGMQHNFRMKMRPLDLRRLILEANEFGLYRGSR